MEGDREYDRELFRAEASDVYVEERVRFRDLCNTLSVTILLSVEMDRVRERECERDVLKEDFRRSNESQLRLRLRERDFICLREVI